MHTPRAILAFFMQENIFALVHVEIGNFSARIVFKYLGGVLILENAAFIFLVFPHNTAKASQNDLSVSLSSFLFLLLTHVLTAWVFY